MTTGYLHYYINQQGKLFPLSTTVAQRGFHLRFLDWTIVGKLDYLVVHYSILLGVLFSNLQRCPPKICLKSCLQYYRTTTVPYATVFPKILCYIYRNRSSRNFGFGLVFSTMSVSGPVYVYVYQAFSSPPIYNPYRWYFFLFCLAYYSK